jgi:hypothetical protein
LDPQALQILQQDKDAVKIFITSDLLEIISEKKLQLAGSSGYSNTATR